ARAADRSSCWVQLATSCVTQLSVAMYDLVAATLVSAPACSGTATSASCISGESGVLHNATVKAPLVRASSVAASRSGLCPDWEIVTNRTPRMSVFASYSELSEGAAEEVSEVVCASMR